MTKQRRLSWSALPLSLLLALPVPALGQRTPQKKTQPPVKEKSAPQVSESGPTESELPAFAVSLVIALATDARSYTDVALRPRVLARSADVLWDADNVTARALFKRAWDAAEQGDAEEVTIKTKDKPPAMVMAMRRMSGRDLRFEVLSVIARRDRALAEEFFAKLKGESEAEESRNKQPPNDTWTITDALAKRLQVASALLKDGQPEKALEFATPALNYVNVHTINFLSDLRAKNSALADRAFATLLSRAESDPMSDANTVSGLSSYVFTPGLFVTFQPQGGVRWSQPDEPMGAFAEFPASLRDRFFQVAGGILLRPIAKQPGMEGRTERYNVIRRLLPLFEQYAPETAAALRSQLTELGSHNDTINSDHAMLTQGIAPEPSSDDVLDRMQDRIDRAKTPAERDQIYAAAASALLAQGDLRARDVAEKIEDQERRIPIQQFIDFEFVQRAIRKKDAAEALRLVQTGKLTNTQRAAAYIDVSRLFPPTEQRASELLEAAVREIRRIEGDKTDRAILLAGVANQFVAVDRVRAWEIVDEVVKEANRIDEFTGDNTVTLPLMTRSTVKFVKIGGENFSLTKLFRTLAKNDLYRAVDMAKSFKYDAPRATVTLAIAGSILQPK
jgi:hypothetical protein